VENHFVARWRLRIYYFGILFNFLDIQVFTSVANMWCSLRSCSSFSCDKQGGRLVVGVYCTVAVADDSRSIYMIGSSMVVRICNSRHNITRDRNTVTPVSSWSSVVSWSVNCRGTIVGGREYSSCATCFPVPTSHWCIDRESTRMVRWRPAVVVPVLCTGDGCVRIRA